MALGMTACFDSVSGCKMMRRKRGVQWADDAHTSAEAGKGRQEASALLEQVWPFKLMHAPCD